jgi:hypothetical protein
VMVPNTSRQAEVLNYLREKAVARTARQIVAGAPGIYREVRHGKADRCFDDLKSLERRSLVRRLPGRPARWEPAAAEAPSLSGRSAA